MMTLALYARVSTIEERDSEGKVVRKRQDPENQLLKLRQYAANRSAQAVEFVDECSASNDYRPALDAMMARVKMHEFDQVVITKLDRIMRSLRNTIDIVERLERSHVHLMVLDQNIDFGTASGRLQFEILAAVAEFEKELIHDRTRDGLARARAQGKVLGRPKVPDAKASERTMRRRRAKEKVKA